VSRLDEVTRDVPAVRAAKSEVDAAVRGRVESGAAVGDAEAACREAVTPMDVPPSVRTDTDPYTWHADLTNMSSWLHNRMPMFAARARLLHEWDTTVSGETRQLYPELIRYADVIAATAIGAGSRAELSEVDFDLAVVDEAGQIAIPDILVPLARVRRGVIVGDHRQLPPFLADEVRKWGVAEGDPVVETLLTKSAIEVMVERFPVDNVVPLTVQRRMPAVIADFISSAFYDGQLATDVARPHRDDLFAEQFAFVDTSSLPTATRRETKADAERFGRPGFVNEAEAELLVRLAAHYHRLRTEWAVIVPYLAQVDLIRSRLNGIVGNSAIVELNVGTVDSFQGGERDVILYGFTRSNDGGRVGFLDELRRANVAFTRAKQQLVLIGDLRMLADANNAQFRALLRELRDYLREHGEIQRYQDIRDRLGDGDKGHEPWHD
jgi:superfamily I DNA and/or RNA helicase